MMDGYPVHGALEVVDEGLLEVAPGVDGVGIQTLEPVERSCLGMDHFQGFVVGGQFLLN
jgi:hypothetical protein